MPRLCPEAWRLPSRRRSHAEADAEASQGRLQTAFNRSGRSSSRTLITTRQGVRDLGCIFQFDAATGTDAFLAQASNKKQEYWFSDGENAAFVGTDDKPAHFVEDDVVQMKAISLGSYCYDT